VAPIAAIIASFDVQHMQYADDTTLYIALDSNIFNFISPDRQQKKYRRKEITNIKYTNKLIR
jgi:hypothetical protein